MTGTWDLTIRLVPPAGAGPLASLTQVGAVHMAAALVLRPLPSVSRVEVDPDEMTLVLTVLDPERTAEEIEALVASVLPTFQQSVVDLSGWGLSATAVEGLASGEEVDGIVLEDSEAQEAEIQEQRGSLFAAAELLRGLSAGQLTPEKLGGLSGTARGDALRRADGLAGCLIQGADLMLDQLFDDLHVLEAAYDDALENGELGSPLALDLDELPQLAGLPGQYRELYTPDFVRAFIVATTDLTSRLTSTWREPACPAQDLAFRRLLDTAGEIAEALGIELPFEWRERLLSALGKADEVAQLYDPAGGGPDFATWFTPYGPDHTLPPYVMPYPTD